MRNRQENNKLNEVDQKNAVKSGGENKSEYKKGLLCILLCQLIWGLCPIYWQSLEPIPSHIIILYRIVTMFVYAYIAARFRYSREEIWKPLREKSVRRKYFAAGLILTANWSIYIWAMTSERVIQSSIGYYIEPIVICAVGIFLFKEKVTRYNLTAMLMALAAVVIILIHYRQIPGVALGLAGTWATYSAIKKTSDKPAILTMVYETMIYACLALAAIIFLECSGRGAIGTVPYGKYALMFLSGLVTLIPVSLFSASANKVPLFIIGLAQYISPSITLILGIFVFKEPIDMTQIIAFCIIWAGLVFFSIGEFKNSRKQIQESSS